MKQEQINRMLSEGWVTISLNVAWLRQDNPKYMILWRPAAALPEKDQYCLCKEVM